MLEPDPDAIDYYARIGVRPDADAETIERRRKQADRRFSPMGTSPDADEKRHMQINEASTVLEDPDRRSRYDDLYEALGPINGTFAYETLPADLIDEVRADGTLCDHLRGFVEILGPKAGSREFQRYYDDLATPLPEEIGDHNFPNGYAVEDAGFGIAAWSWHRSEQPCPLSLWLTGGRDLWRTALLEPDAVDAQLETLRDAGPARVPAPGVSAGASGASDDAETPTTQINLGHPSSAVTSRPIGRTTGEERDELTASMADTATRLTTPLDRLWDALSYIGATGVATGRTVAGTVGGGVAGALAVAVLFVPLLAGTLVIQSSTAADLGAGGVPLVGLEAPLATESILHYLTIGLLVTLPAWATGRRIVPWLHERKETPLPRDAWFVFLLLLVALAGSLFVGIGRSALPQWSGLTVTALLTVVTFQASMDIGAPRPLSLLCRSVATIAFGLASSVVSLSAVGFGLSVIQPAVFDTYVAAVASAPAVESGLFGPENAELLVVAAGALAFVPLALTTLYSLAYALESVALRIRSHDR
ncbi:MAG: DnaJ domain-containing protein [Halapricum sp.]